MKKIGALLLTILFFAFFVSCESLMFDKTDKKVTQNEERKHPSEGIQEYFYYPKNMTLTETPTRILYTLNGRIYYYNKITDESNIFCFEPLCNHVNWRECISLKFVENGTNTSIQYCEYDNRFYAFRGQKLCSFSFDGSDLKIEYSLGEDGDFDTFAYDPFGTFSMHIFGARVYFISLNGQDGTRELWCYDIQEKKAMNLSSCIDMAVLDYVIQEDLLTLAMRSDQESGIYRSDLNMQQLMRISENPIFDMAHPVLVGDSIYDVAYKTVETDQGRKMVADAIVCLNFENEDVKRIYEFEGAQYPTILAVTEENIYFKQMEQRSIGYELVRGETKVERNNVYSRIYRVDINNGKCEVVFDDLTCQVSEIYFLEEDKILIIGEECTIGEGEASKEGMAFIANIRDNGMFDQLRSLEVQG